MSQEAEKTINMIVTVIDKFKGNYKGYSEYAAFNDICKIITAYQQAKIEELMIER